MRPLFPPTVGFPSERRNSSQSQSKTITNQKLPKILEESLLVSKEKRESILEVFFSCFSYFKKLQN
ncbi:hypothetical protein RHT_00353 [Candidatus Rhabdochlamydia sp. T3358]|nr:hypothetical protein RHT_00353 [Candidatus Rhabdochlamydia sp. T3358]